MNQKVNPKNRILLEKLPMAVSVNVTSKKHERQILSELYYPTDLDIRDVFLDLWSKAVGTTDYNKKEWQALRQALFIRNIEI